MLYVIQKDAEPKKLLFVKAADQDAAIELAGLKGQAKKVWLLSDVDVSCLESNSRVLLER